MNHHFRLTSYGFLLAILASAFAQTAASADSEFVGYRDVFQERWLQGSVVLAFDSATGDVLANELDVILDSDGCPGFDGFCSNTLAGLVAVPHCANSGASTWGTGEIVVDRVGSPAKTQLFGTQLDLSLFRVKNKGVVVSSFVADARFGVLSINLPAGWRPHPMTMLVAESKGISVPVSCFDGRQQP